mmetsp:Transcript_17523/g.48740  ORF Transcript_17523/g.48740 Transcript_17523/m.48740 type:complete len:231 (+) Transcript_17523:869-1561(+)
MGTTDRPNENEHKHRHPVCGLQEHAVPPAEPCHNIHRRHKEGALLYGAQELPGSSGAVTCMEQRPGGASQRPARLCTPQAAPPGHGGGQRGAVQGSSSCGRHVGHVPRLRRQDGEGRLPGHEHSAHLHCRHESAARGGVRLGGIEAHRHGGGDVQQQHQPVGRCAWAADGRLGSGAPQRSRVRHGRHAGYAGYAGGKAGGHGGGGPAADTVPRAHEGAPGGLWHSLACAA